MLALRILGPLDVERDGARVRLGGAKQQAVLALLLLEDGRPVSSTRLIDGLWGASPPPSAAKAVQLYVSQLRKLLGSDAIETRGDSYALNVAGATVDLREFERLAGDGRAQAGAGRPEAAARLFAEADAIWRGEPLAGLDDPGLVAPRQRLDELRLLAHEMWIDARLALGHHADLVPELTMLARRHPLRERLHEQLMLALYREGRQADALETCRRLRDRLRDELGLEPHARVRDLERAILRQDASLDAPPSLHGARTVVVAAADPEPVVALLAPLARSIGAELVILAPVGSSDEVAAASARLEPFRSSDVRVAAFVTDDAVRDVGRLARDDGAEVVVVAGQDAPPLACDVAVLVGALETPIAGEVSVLFGGSTEDWRAVELAAVLARAHGVPLRLVGVVDAGALLARAALVVQRFAGIATVPTPFVDGRLHEAVAGSIAVAGSAAAARVSVGELGVPVLVLRAGVRPGLLAPPETMTMFRWSLLG